MIKETQKSKVMQWLETGKSITPIHALEMFGCFRLAAVIHDIKLEEVFMHNKTIKTEMIKNKFGTKYGSYKLIKKINNTIICPLCKQTNNGCARCI
tara:strand:- start:10767 stop:11054 length:288 start_codon:yes stop_codon:yes gene_type:complete